MQGKLNSATDKEEVSSITKIGNSTFFAGEDGIVYVVLTGEINGKLAAEMAEIIKKYACGRVDGKINILCDMNKAGQSSYEAREIYRGIMKNDIINKAAMFGLHTVAKMLASFIIAYLNLKIARFFRNKEEAILWLKE